MNKKLYIAEYSRNLIPGVGGETLDMFINEQNNPFTLDKVDFNVYIQDLTTGAPITLENNDVLQYRLEISSQTTPIGYHFENNVVPAGGAIAQGNDIRLFKTGVRTFEQSFISNQLRFRFAYHNVDLILTVRMIMNLNVIISYYK